MTDSPAPELDELPPSGRRTALLVAVPVAVVIGLLVVLLGTRDDSQDRVGKSPLVGQVAPVIEGTDLDGAPFDLDRLRGQWVVVNFFQTECIPCVEEHPELVAFSEAHARSGDASVVSVAFDDSPSNVRSFFERNGGDWPVLAEGTGPVAIRYGVLAVPESYLVAPNGVVVAKLIGGVKAEHLDELIAEVTAASEAQA